MCAKDGSIVFTSVRDGDLDLYRMDADGKNVQRLTSTPGYDGGAFFNADCTKIVWRASRPEPGQRARGLQAPARAEPGAAHQARALRRERRRHRGAPGHVLPGASFAPYFYPSGKRIIFASNYGDPKGREFDIWAIDTDGTRLERITYGARLRRLSDVANPDGQWLAFASNRARRQAAGRRTHFVTRWVE